MGTAEGTLAELVLLYLKEDDRARKDQLAIMMKAKAVHVRNREQCTSS